MLKKISNSFSTKSAHGLLFPVPAPLDNAYALVFWIIVFNIVPLKNVLKIPTGEISST